MTDWTPGQKSDATKVAELARSSYVSPQKNAIREWVGRWLQMASPSLVLDLWGGGQSAEWLTGLGMSVLSVDRPGNAKTGWRSRGISVQRARRAIEIKAEAGGYQFGWGPAARFAHLCDAAWLDLCGHWCPDTAELIRSCRHMSRFALTLMPERTPLNGSRLSVDEWIVALKALVEDAGSCRVTVVHKYRRPGNQWALVFLCVHSVARERARQKQMEWRSVPEHRAQAADRARAKASELTAGQLRYAYIRARMADPDYRKKVRDRANASRRKRMQDPDYRAKVNAYEAARMSAKYRNDPEYREEKRTRENARRKELRAERKAQERAA